MGDTRKRIERRFDTTYHKEIVQKRVEEKIRCVSMPLIISISRNIS
jgi:hypothetical protein